MATAAARVLSHDKGRQPTQSLRVTSLAQRGKATLAKKKCFLYRNCNCKSAVPCSGETTTAVFVFESDFPCMERKSNSCKRMFFYIATAAVRVQSLVQGRQPQQFLRVTSLVRRGKATLAKFLFFYITTAAARVQSPEIREDNQRSLLE